MSCSLAFVSAGGVELDLQALGNPAGVCRLEVVRVMPLQLIGQVNNRWDQQHFQHNQAE